eukprot:CAMPEP_0176108522 /NCGR_PEP_ID=MMETSP0120_2-20121206/54479_1 /TAXON_ID=160619 /ORGANISM="Kryptoperidinium foliaceum, Strain CCMP 1326" /LENGTH=399 /DNA_ID=CAMNT_0017442691 /DNA_START=53 /DNA_END=1252 /DNA_ORIENTATION=+
MFARIALSTIAGIGAFVAAAEGDSASCVGEASSLLQATPIANPEAAKRAMTGSRRMKTVQRRIVESNAVDLPMTFVGTAAPFENHPNYTNPHYVFGEVWVSALDGISHSSRSQQLTWKLVDVDPLCAKGRGTSENSCGIRLTEGNPCRGGNDAKSLYDQSARLFDPWRRVSYTSDLVDIEAELVATGGSTEEKAQTVLITSVETGLTAAQVKGGSIVVHDYSGKIMACGSLKSAFDVQEAPTLLQQRAGPLTALQAIHFKRIPGPSNLTDVFGQVLAYEIMGDDTPLLGHYLLWDFEDVDVRCAKGPISPGSKSCGIQITSSTSCKTLSEEPFYNPDAVESDPWEGIGYTSAKGSDVVVARNVGISVLTGHDSPDIIDHTVIVHDFDGVPAACASFKIK